MEGYTMNEPMNIAETIPNRATPEPLPENIHSVQPGGGVCCRIELALGPLAAMVAYALPPGLCRAAWPRCARATARTPRTRSSIPAT